MDLLDWTGAFLCLVDVFMSWMCSRPYGFFNASVVVSSAKAPRSPPAHALT